MKLKIIFSLCCFFLIFSTVDTDNISIEVDRLEDESIEISWSIQYEGYDQIFLEIQHLDGNYAFQVPSKSGELQLCCYPDEFKVILTVQITKTVDEKIFVLKEEISLMNEKYEMTLLEFNYLSSPSKLIDFHREYFEEELYQIDFQVIGSVSKSDGILIENKFNLDE